MFLTESQFRDALHWYQKKIGSYDQQVWEKSIEERVLRGLSHAIPKKVARVKKESIDLDLDLIRGSYFAKAKPQQSWLTTTYLGIVRILLFPFYLNWWTEQTNPLICAILFILYCLQMISMYIYFNSEKDEFDEIPISEVVSPLFMFFILGTMQSQIGASSSSKNRSYRSRLNPTTSTSTNNTTESTSIPLASSSLSSIPTTTPTITTATEKHHSNISTNDNSVNDSNHHRVNSSSSKSSLNHLNSKRSSSLPSPSMTLRRNSRQSPINNEKSNLIIGLCKNCSKHDTLKEEIINSQKDAVKESPSISPSTSSSIDAPDVDKSSPSTSSRCKKYDQQDELKLSDDESGLDSMETPNGTPKEEEEDDDDDDDDDDEEDEEDDVDNDDEAEEEDEDEDERETRLRKRKVLTKHVNTNLTKEKEEEDNSDNSSTPGSCSPSADQSPSPSISTPSSTKSTPGYSGRRKSFSQKISNSQSKQVEYEVKKEVNTDTEPDGTIGDLSSADECSPYSTVDSNNRFEWSRKYNITSPTTGIPIDGQRGSACKSSPVNFCLSQETINNGQVSSISGKTIKINNHPTNTTIDHNNLSDKIIKGQRSIIIDRTKSSSSSPLPPPTTPSSSTQHHHHHHHPQHRLQFCLPVSCPKAVGGGGGGGRGGGVVDGCSSSGESECSISPTSPITKLASDLDWPSINSDGTSDDEGEMMMGVDVDVSHETLRKLNDDENREFFNFNEQTSRSLSSASSNHHHHIHTHHHHHHSNQQSHSHHHHHRENHHHHHHHHQYHHHHHTPSISSYSPEETNQYNQRTGKTLNDKVSCAIWQTRECQKVDLSVLDISSAIIRKVESVKHSNEYFYLGFLLSLVLAFIPVIFRIRQFATSQRFTETRRSKVTPTSFTNSNSSKEILSDIIQEIPTLATDLLAETMVHSFSSLSVQFVVLVAIIERFFLSLCFFFLLCVAERTFRERFLYAKYFCHLTSSRRARRSDLPHFRLNKVRNIKTWLSVRSYLQNHGPQRSIDAIVSSSFIVEVSILTFLCIQLLRDNEICSEKLYCWEMVFWNLAIGLYIMRLIILGSKMNRKNRGCLTILLSEQINLYLQLEQKPHKKEDLTLANQLIKSAADVLKLLEAPFKISGFSANPYLYNITKVIVLSAFSAVLTELLGFKLKLYKIKLTS